MLKRFIWLTIVLMASAGSVLAATFTDSAGRVVEVPGKINKVFAAGGPAAVMIYALAPEKLAGWVHAPTEEQKADLIPSTQNLPVYGALTARDGATSIDRLSSAKPDLIIDVGTISPRYIALADKIQKQTGIPYVLVDGSLGRSGKALREIGYLIGVDQHADELSTFVSDRMKTLAATMEDIPAKERPRIFYARGPKGLQTGSAGSIDTELFDALGVANIATPAGQGGLADVTLAQVTAWNPDVIITGDAAALAAIRNDPGWSSLKAVRDGKVYKAPDLPFGWIDSPPGINRLMGLIWLENLLYPNKFQLDVRAEIRDFYDLFYQVDMMEEDFDELSVDSGIKR